MTDRARRHILLLAGSAEAREIATELSSCTDLRVTASLACAPRVPGDLPVPQRFGGFGGDAGFARWLDAQGVDAVLDATHPFAEAVSARTARICAASGRAHLQVLRPPWRPGPGDRWTEVAGTAEAAGQIGPGTNVFTTTGRGMLAGFRALRGGHLFVRVLSDDARPAETGMTYICGAGPFSEPQERETLSRLGIGALVCKNSGGQASRSKLDAARALGLPVYLVSRPPPLEAHVVATAREAVEWARAL